MAAEDRLRELLADPRWSLPPWPDPAIQARRAAARQRRATGAAVLACAVGAAMLTVLAVSGRAAARTAVMAAGQRTRSTPGLHLSASRLPALRLPALDAAGFPAAVYPTPVPAATAVPAALCPARTGLQVPRPAAVTAAVRKLGTGAASLTAVLAQADRAYWPQLADGWRHGTVMVFSRAGAVVYSGPLQRPRRLAGTLAAAQSAAHPAAGSLDEQAAVPVQVTGRPQPAAGRQAAAYQQAVQEQAVMAQQEALAGSVTAACGQELARRSWLVVAALPAARAAASAPGNIMAALFLTRRGHVLLYGTQ